ncbi:hypothetical protein ACCAA_720024 [Candidatus Accumulibacter aalborgensis]|uniref:Uncharacterized protein n=1 Tax=Candidatus Accumulibacter aalborgensis TaxID=1860102 RepID=A0A1A8XY12_9PROT|nr:hypothetical protein ACCAA_720024 [Candidatus Accumulibacter aalborgensis]
MGQGRLARAAYLGGPRPQRIPLAQDGAALRLNVEGARHEALSSLAALALGSAQERAVQRRALPAVAMPALMD